LKQLFCSAVTLLLASIYNLQALFGILAEMKNSIFKGSPLENVISGKSTPLKFNEMNFVSRY